ncbi:hypothetical protein BS50DRAFT_641503 [Corynespora cassiicola Philippines]|uniref:Uncharacterized protein n=1 Tax=Corynespora cassiicola Philippines TaxID=1448308 RepID=A0A2T2MZR9_CORCC|nr:hypothetical protein BS50DRAFT_641543 [Corynespora cassiicola Philippines]PSN58760.1 hypothetical protein BS50DRAFT_641503 [Corynespora cassiicola Philippines]
MPAFSWGIDVPDRQAVISGSGDDLFTLAYIRGSDVTLDQIVAIAERIIGSKFNAIYDNLEDLKQGKVTPLAERKNGGDGT